VVSPRKMVTVWVPLTADYVGNGTQVMINLGAGALRCAMSANPSTGIPKLYT
jgi:hypothetical protein